VVVNHYTGAPGYPYTYEQLRDWGVDGFEIVNGGRIRAASIRQFCLDNNLACVASTDEHMNMEVSSFVRINLTSPSNISEIFTELKKNTHQAIAVSYQSDIFNIPGKTWNGLEDIGNYFKSINIGQMTSWISWSLIILTGTIIALVGLHKANFNRFFWKLIEDQNKCNIILKYTKKRT
jgi:hypothetical protein